MCVATIIMTMPTRRRPGEVRDAILEVLSAQPNGASVQTIEQRVTELTGSTAASSVRSYLRLNTPSLFVRTARAHYVLKYLVKRQSPTKAIVALFLVKQLSFMLIA